MTQRRDPEQIGPYRIESRIGLGGMGIVYRAVATERSGLVRAQSTVALKVVHEHLVDDPEYLRRFARESQIAQAIESPNVVRVLDFGEDGGRPYQVMEILPRSLADVLRGTPLPEDTSREIAEDVARGLQAAYEGGVVHRDLSPGNIMLTNDGVAKIADYGIARMSGLSTMTGQAFLGKPQYASPEHFGGRVDIRSDLYSFGIILYQMLAGVVPFEGDTPFDYMRHHDSTPVPALPDSVAPDLRAIVERLTAKNPDDRFPTPADLLAALEAGGEAGAAATSPDPDATQVLPAAAPLAPDPDATQVLPPSTPAAPQTDATQVAPAQPAAPEPEATMMAPAAAASPGPSSEEQGTVLAAPESPPEAPTMGGAPPTQIGGSMGRGGMGGVPPVALYGGGAVIALLVIVGAIVLFTSGGDDDPPPVVGTGTATESPTTETETATATTPPTSTPEVTPEPPVATITEVRTADTWYEVALQTAVPDGTDPPGGYVFYFDSVDLEDLASPDSGAVTTLEPDGPFIGLGPLDRPPGATEVCVILEDGEGELIEDSGSCAPIDSAEITSITHRGRPLRRGVRDHELRPGGAGPARALLLRQRPAGAGRRARQRAVVPLRRRLPVHRLHRLRRAQGCRLDVHPRGVPDPRRAPEQRQLHAAALASPSLAATRASVSRETFVLLRT